MKKITFTIILCSLLNSLTAQITIQGKVSDEISPLEWANVYIKNSSTGTSTDGHGHFTLEVKKGDTLSISYIGYQTQEIVIDNQEFIPIALENESLDEVIVHALGTTTCSYTISCSFSTIIKEIEEIKDVQSTNSNLPTLFPNPSSNGIFHLKMPFSSQEVEVTVSNLLGQQVYSKMYQNTNTNIALDISHVKTGIYLINVVADGQRLPTQKAIRK